MWSRVWKDHPETDHLEIHPIYSEETQTLFWMPTSTCSLQQDIAVTWEALLVHDKYRGGHSQLAIELSTRSPVGELEKGAEGVCSTIGGTTI